MVRVRKMMLTGVERLLFLCIASSVVLQTCRAATTSGKRTSAFDLPAPKRQNTAGGRKVMDPAFENVGQTAGLQIWRIEDFKPVPYPKNQYGKFYTGDSYIVLNTKILRDGRKIYDLHFWLGSETSQDEAGAAAVLTVQLDDSLNGDAIQHREVQEHESELFLSYFKSGGIRYLPGGVISGFHHVDPNAFETKLFQVKGSRNIRVKEVSPSISSMNNGDCFILDVGRQIFVYVGTKARRIEKIKAISAANQIRDQDHAGKAKVTIVDEYSPQSDFDEFFQALGSGSRDGVPEEGVGGDDQAFENDVERHVTLYRVSDKTGAVQITPVARKPFAASALDPNDCFILDTTDAHLYVWIGKKCDEREKREAMKKADEFIHSKNHPKWTHVQRIIQGGEPAAFTQYFSSWQASGELHPRLFRSISNEKPLARLYHCQIRSKAGRFITEEIHDFEQEDLWEEDVMIVDAGTKVYLWVGKGASDEERSRGPKFAEIKLIHQGREDIEVEVVNQGDEPEEFKELFPSWEDNFWDNLPDVRKTIVNED